MSGVIQICLSVSGPHMVMWVVVSLLYVGVVRCVIRLKYIPMAAGRLSRPVHVLYVHLETVMRSYRLKNCNESTVLY